MASTIASKDTVLTEYPTTSSTAKLPMTLTGTAMAGIIVARRLPRKKKTTITTSVNAIANVISTSRIGRAYERRRVVVDDIMESGREPLAQAVHRRDDRRSGADRVGARREIEPDRDRRFPVEPAFDILVLGAEIDPCDVAHAQERAVGVRAQHDVAELLRGRELPLGLDVHLELLVMADRPRPDTADRRLHVLRLNSRNDVGRRQVQIVQALACRTRCASNN